jgi:hypothetical protein
MGDNIFGTPKHAWAGAAYFKQTLAYRLQVIHGIEGCHFVYLNRFKVKQ